MTTETPTPDNAHAVKARKREVPLTAEERALRERIRASSASVKEIPLSQELRALREEAKALRTAARASHQPRPNGRPRLSDEERAARSRDGLSYQTRYWRENKAAIMARRKARFERAPDEEREKERRRRHSAHKKSRERQKATMVELLKTVEALSSLLANEGEDALLTMGNAT